MIESIISLSQGGNTYLYNTGTRYLFLLHPSLKKVLDRKEEEIDPYYLKKYEYLKKYVLECADSIEFEASINESVVREGIIQSQQVAFETTDFCNLRCTYCSLGDLYTFNKPGKKDMDVDKALRFLRYMFDLKAENSTLSISFFGGEPLMNFDFIRIIVEEAKILNKTKNLSLSFNMTTNATLLHKHMDFLVENSVRLLISLDGDEVAQGYRVMKNGEPSFQRVISNLDQLLEKYPVYFEDCISFNSVLHDRNSVREIYEFIYGRYHKVPMISPLNTGFVNPEKKDCLKGMLHSKVKSEGEFLDSNSDLLPVTHKALGINTEVFKFLRNYSVNSYYSNVLSLLYDKVKTVPTGTCPPFRRKLFLNTQCQLLPCEKVSHNHFLGTVDDDAVTVDIQRISEKYNAYYKHIVEQCSKCYVAKACPVCLLAQEHIDRLESKDFVCPAFVDADAFKLNLSRYLSFMERYPEDLVEMIENSFIA